MAEIIGMAGTLLGLVDIITLRPIVQNFLVLKEDYGVLRALLLVFVFPDAREVIGRIRKHILRSSSAEAMAMKKLLTDDCTMLVAAAIVAQIAITALSLDGLSAVHWTAKASFIISLVTAALSVFFACCLQQKLSALFGPEDLKDWLSIQGPEQRLRSVREVREATERYKQDLASEYRDEHLRSVITKLNELARKMTEELRWNRASFNAAFMIKSPALLLNWSVVAFLPGLGIYLGYFWTHNLDETQSQDSSLNILIVYIVFTFAGILLFYVPRILKYLETTSVRKWDDLFNYDKNPSGERSDVLGHDDPSTDDIYRRIIYALGDPSEGTSESKINLEKLGKAEVSLEVGSEGLIGAPNSKKNQEKTAAGPSGEATHANNQAEVSSTENPQHCQLLTDPVAAALEAAIRAQEQSTAALRALLTAHTQG